MVEDRELLHDLLAERTPAWTLRVTLTALREQGLPFEKAWASAIQRLRVQPHMSAAQAEELADYKAILSWARPLFRYHYEQAPAPAPQLPEPDDLTDLSVDNPALGSAKAREAKRRQGRIAA